MLRTGRAIFRTVALQSWRAGGGDGSRTLRTVARWNLRNGASNSCSTKAFESHRAVFTNGTSIASLFTAWAGYSIRHIHETNVEKRLESIEEAVSDGFSTIGEAMKNYNVEKEIKKIVGSGNVSTTSCMAAAETSLIIGSGNVSTVACIAAVGTSLAIGYCLGWCGGSSFVLRKFRREHLKLMGQMKLNRWQFFKRPFFRSRNPRTVKKHAGLPPITNSPCLPSKHYNFHGTNLFVAEIRSWFTVYITK